MHANVRAVRTLATAAMFTVAAVGAPTHAAVVVPVQADEALDSTIYNGRRFVVPSGAYPRAATFEVASPNRAHVIVKSEDDLTLPPETVPHNGGGHFDHVAGRIERITAAGVGLSDVILDVTNDLSTMAISTHRALVPEDTDGGWDVYAVVDGTPQLVTPGDGQAFDQYRGMAADGSLILFRTKLKLDPADLDAVYDIYGWSRGHGVLHLITPGVAPMDEPAAIADDGSRVLFVSGENLTGIDPGPSNQPFIYQWTPSGGVTLRGRGTFVDWTDDGSFVYFNTTASLVPADEDADTDAYVHDVTGFRLVSPRASDASLVAVRGDGAKWALLSNQTLTDDDAPGISVFVESSAAIQLFTSAQLDAILLDDAFETGIFRSWSPLVPEDIDEWPDVYRWTADDPTPVLISGQGILAVDPVLYASDGQRALMTSTQPQLPDDVDAFADLYEWTADGLTLLTDAEDGPTLNAATPDLRRLVISGAHLTSESLHFGNLTEAYLADADLVPPAAEVEGPPNGLSSGHAAFVLGSADGDGVVFDCALDGAPMARCDRQLTLSGLSAGPHHLDVIAYDVAGNASESVGIDWTVDLAPPTATIPLTAIRTGALSGGKPVLRLTWTGADSGSGVARFELSQSVDSGAWTTVTTALLSPTVDRAVNAGRTYRYRIRPIDRAGNVGAWATGGTVKVTAVSESSTSMTYRGTWKLSNSSLFWGGKARSATAAGASATLRFTGRSVALVAFKGPTRGLARIYLGSTVIGTVDLRAPAGQGQQVVWSKSWSTSATRSIVVKVVGTPGRPMVTVDGFIVLT